MLWLTDIHIDYKSETVIEAFLDEITLIKTCGICITGDIAEKEKSIEFIKKLSDKVKIPVYFVLGNHDFYGSEIETFQQKISTTFIDKNKVFYLPSHQLVPIDNNAAIVGIDNWYDFSKGDYFSSKIKLKDFKEIKNLIPLNKMELFSYMQNHSKKLVKTLEKKLINAFDNFKNVILLTHVPPFQNACLYQNQVADEMWAPFFVHGLLGDFLECFMQEKPYHNLTVLSGHTHNKVEYSPTFNLQVKVGSCPSESFAWDFIDL